MAGRIIDLPPQGTLLVATDMQGNLRDFMRLVEVYEEHRQQQPETFLVVTGDLVHGPELEPDEWPPHLGSYYVGESAEVLEAAAVFQQKHPGYVHYLLGNHEHAHIGGPVVGKFFPDEAARLEELLGPQRTGWVRQWLTTWPLVAVASRARLCLLHGAPHAPIQSRADIERIDLDALQGLGALDFAARSVLGSLLWARAASRERARSFLQALGPTLSTAIHGHDVVREGFVVEDATHICVSSSFGCHDGDKLYVAWDLSEPAISALDVARRGLRRLWPESPPVYLDPSLRKLMSQSNIPDEEERLLERVKKTLAAVPTQQRPRGGDTQRDYEQQLLELRDEVAQARLEDVPALVAQMERISGVAARRAEVQEAPVDAAAPYFAHLRLRENDKERDVLIGRGTHIDSRSGVRIVDWRHAPISQLYYRYPEGASYEESFGGREVEGEVVVRRTVTIYEGRLWRIQAPQGIFVCQNQGQGPWKHHELRPAELTGGQGTAARPSTARGTLGVGPDGDQRVDRHLPEIAALLDPRQFELISAPDAGVVVIQGGAGSGKTTIGLHRIAYLAYRDAARFQPDRMLVVTYGVALGAYISEVLPSLGVPGVKVVTFADWAHKLREGAYPWVDAVYEEDTPPAVTRLKKHPALLKLLAERVRQQLSNPRASRSPRVALALWAEVLTDRGALEDALSRHEGPAMSERDLNIAHRWCTERCVELIEIETKAREGDDGDRSTRKSQPPPPRSMAEEDEEEPSLDEDDDSDDDTGIDGRDVEEKFARLDREDDALLLRVHQLLCGPLKKGKHPLVYEHAFVDEAQDLAPVELAVLLDTVSSRRSVTLAGDTAQKLYLDNGFRDWRSTLDDLGLSSTEIEPLRIAYRSTREVMQFARDVLGPLADPTPPEAPRSGAPVEAHLFPQQGAAVAFLADALRPLFAREPRASVGILARFPEQADAYYEVLARSEIPNVRRVRNQEFVFRPGVDVTDIRQVKGLEFDYVVLVDVNASVFPADEASRHLLHIAATRAAHQLWLIVTGQPSPLLPDRVLDMA